MRVLETVTICALAGALLCSAGTLEARADPGVPADTTAVSSTVSYSSAEAWNYYDQGEYEKALSVCPQKEIYLRARCLEETGELVDAHNNYDLLWSGNPMDPEINYRMAKIYRMLWQEENIDYFRDMGLVHCETALENMPHSGYFGDLRKDIWAELRLLER